MNTFLIVTAGNPQGSTSGNTPNKTSGSLSSSETGSSSPGKERCYKLQANSVEECLRIIGESNFVTAGLPSREREQLTKSLQSGDTSTAQRILGEHHTTIVPFNDVQEFPRGNRSTAAA